MPGRDPGYFARDRQRASVGRVAGEPGRTPPLVRVAAGLERAVGGAGQFPYTPSVTDVTGLEAACDEVLAEGVAQSIARHGRCRARLPRGRAGGRA